MKRKSITSFLLLTIMCCLMAVCGVAAAEGAPRVAVLYTNNAKTTYDVELDNCVLSSLEKTLSSKKYQYVKDDAALKNLADMGMNDLSMAERRDIIDALKGADYSHIICIIIEPMVRKEKFSMFTQGIEMTATVPFKIINVKEDRYIYNGKFVEKQGSSTPIGSVGNKSVALKTLNKINQQISKIVNEKM